MNKMEIVGGALLSGLAEDDEALFESPLSVGSAAEAADDLPVLSFRSIAGIRLSCDASPRERPPEGAGPQGSASRYRFNSSGGIIR